MNKKDKKIIKTLLAMLSIGVGVSLAVSDVNIAMAPIGTIAFYKIGEVLSLK